MHTFAHEKVVHLKVCTFAHEKVVSTFKGAHLCSREGSTVHLNVHTFADKLFSAGTSSITGGKIP